MRVNVYAEELRPITDKYGDRVSGIQKQLAPSRSNKNKAINILFGNQGVHSHKKREKK